MRRSWVVIVFVVAACTPQVEPEPATTTTTQPPVATTSVAPIEVPPCLAGEAPFIESGSASPPGRTAGDARTLREISWDEFERCDRLVFSFGSEAGAPAVVPPAVATFLDRATGVLRVSLPAEVDGSVIATQLVDTKLVDRVFVVRTADGTLALDVHLAAAALARVQASTAPSRITVDLVPGGSGYGSSPLLTEDVVVLTPTGGSVAYPFAVTGYRWGDLGAVRVSTPSASQEATTTTAEGSDGWSSFVALFPDGPTGPVVLELGDVVLDLFVTG
ncbi:MAG: hypothetical protein R6X29_09370 [Acidimicrobiia bacterium]|jgi:hypothetical protein